MKKLIFSIILSFLFLIGCSSYQYTSTPRYNISILNENGVVVQKYTSVNILSQEVEDSLVSIVFEDASYRVIKVTGFAIIIEEVVRSRPRASYIYYKSYAPIYIPYRSHYNRIPPVPGPRPVTPPPPPRVEPRPTPPPTGRPNNSTPNRPSNGNNSQSRSNSPRGR